ncbi:YqaE/Pmp3 family membrane protein [Rufibacter immobilis]
MKFRSLLQFVMVVLVGQFLFSCSSKEFYRFSSAKPETYQKTIAKAEPVTTATEVASTEAVAPEAEPVLEANAGAPVPVLFETKKVAAKPAAPKPAAVAPTETAEKATLQPQEAAMLESAKHKLATMTKAERKEFKKEVKEALRQTHDTNKILLIILAILIPPLAVGLYEGITSRFWISLLLTLLFFVPGLIYSLLVVTDSI